MGLACLLLLGCPSAEKPPGDESLGSYGFHAQWISTEPPCQLPDISSAPIDFVGTFTRFRDGGGIFLTLNGVPRDAGFDGQIITSTHSATRTFALPDGGSCAPCEMKLVETLTVALLSKSQEDRVSALFGETCPPSPLDGGVPGEDAGVKLPSSAPVGFDAVQACGILEEHIEGSGKCDPLCNSESCKLNYVLTGARQ